MDEQSKPEAPKRTTNSGENGDRTAERVKAWRARIAVATGSVLTFLTVSGLSIWLLPFGRVNQAMVILHTLVGVGLLVPCAWYLGRHLARYWRGPVSHVLVLGYLGGVALVACVFSGVIVTWQAALSYKVSHTWDLVHLTSTLAVVGFALPHILVIALLARRARAAGATSEIPDAAAHYGKWGLAITMAGVLVVLLGAYAYTPVRLRNEFPPDYSFLYGKDRPFAPSLAKTASGGAIDPRSLSGSRSCGTPGCHEEIVQEWESSTHRYAAMDLAFQAIQTTMAKQNGPESTRYCGGCHDPISLFSGTKNLFVDPKELTSLHGFQEGVSCLVCHSVRRVDLKGNAQYSISPPTRYLFELEYDQNPRPTTRFLRDFLIRAYPKKHVNDLSKHLFKTPEYCAACHKQFVDEQINKVGWVQLQNQYDNWRQSRWNHPQNPRKTIECRECHMPLVDSKDPASGDPYDYNRSPNDRKHRSHRFIAANQMMPRLLKLPGWEKQVELTERWLQGHYQIPEIADKWASGPAVALEVVAPEKVRRGEAFTIKVIITSNKVGHDFPTGPLDIIQSWLDVEVVDQDGNRVFHRGEVDTKGFIEPGTFMFKAEPVDQYGNLIDRHNLWEMVGVRFRRSLFPGFSDTAEYSLLCAGESPTRGHQASGPTSFQVGVPKGARGILEVHARLRYRKIDQYLLNFVFGEKAGVTAPITDMDSQIRRIEIAQ